MRAIFNNTLVISFVAQGETYNKTIKKCEIDTEHYDTLWDWWGIRKSEIDTEHYDTLWDWWGGDTDSVYDNMLDFELTGHKDKDGNLIADENLYINVYERDEDHVKECIKDISILECN